MQLLMGISMRRYFPAIGTAGFERSLVSGCSRDPRPPPMMIPKTSFIDGIAASVFLWSVTARCHTKFAFSIISYFSQAGVLFLRQIQRDMPIELADRSRQRLDLTSFLTFKQINYSNFHS